MTETATQATHDAKTIIDLLERDRVRISQIGKAANSALKLHAYLLKRPYLSITRAAAALDISVSPDISTFGKSKPSKL